MFIRMSPTSTYFLLVLAVLVATPGFSATGKSKRVVVTSDMLPPVQTESTTTPDEEEAALVRRLKHLAVVNYLKGAMGPDFAAVESKVTASFAEDYINEYSIGHKPGSIPQGPQTIELTCKLDVGGLRGWINLNAAKVQAQSQLRPMFILSSEVPSLPLSATQSAMSTKATVLGVTVFRIWTEIFQKLNATLGRSEDTSIFFRHPPSQTAEIQKLSEIAVPAGYNSAVWLHLAPCKQGACGVRSECVMYHFGQNRQIVAVRDNLTLSSETLTDPAKVKAAFQNVGAEFGRALEDVISKGTLSGQAFRLIVRNVDSVMSYKKIDLGLGKLDFIIKATPRQLRSGEAEFLVVTPVTQPREFLQNLQLAGFSGFQLQGMSVDSDRVIVRYWNPSVTE